MNMITKAMSVTMLVTQGFTLTAGAAEPSKPEPRKGNDAAGGAESATPTPGTPVDPARFAPELPPGAPSPKPPPPATWKEPETVEIQWGFDATTTGVVTGRVEAWWAAVAKIEPLEEANGLVVLGEHQWREDLGQRKENRRRGLRLTFHGTTGPAPILSLWASAGNCGFNPGDAKRGPILIPRVGLYITKPGSLPVDKFRENLAAKKLRTVREEILATPEESYASAMAREFGENAKKLPEFPKPPYESQMQIDVPEKPLVDQWRLGAWHLKRWCREDADGTWQISIWRFRFLERKGMWDKPGERKDYQTTFEKGHATCIGAESFEIIRAFDVLGGYDNVARGGLNHWLDSKVQIKGNVYGSGFTDFDGILMGVNPHGLALGQAYEYDLKHSGGHGTIMEAAAHHYRMTGNAEWFLRHVPRFKKACEWTLRQRKAWAPNMPKDAWGYGLQPPTNLGDYGGVAMFYYTDAFYYNGLVAVAKIMAELKVEGAEDLLRRAEEYRQDIRAAVERSVARTPVVAVGDGTYRRYVPAAPYSRSANKNDPLNGFLSLAIRDYGVYAPEEPLVRDVVDVVEQTFSGSNGITGQTGHEKHPPIHLLNDDIPLFLRSLYLEYAVVIRPWELEPDPSKNRKGPETPVGPAAYEFFEHPGRYAVDKTFEEAVFLQRLRNMLVMELRDTLWLARATPRAWLEQGKKISVKNSPTYFGMVAYEIVSDVDHGKINATVEMPARPPAPDQTGGRAGKAPKEVVLRFRHPKSTPIKSVTVNGKEWTEFNPDKETITLKGLTGTVAVTAQWAVLSAQPRNLSFALVNAAEQVDPRQVAITYRGGPGTDKPFTINAVDPWVKITAGSGAGHGQTFAVSVDPKGLPLAGHSSKVIVSRSDIPETLVLPVRLLLGASAPKVMTISPTASHCRPKGELRFTLAVQDQFGEPFPAEVRWSVSGGGVITPQGVFTSDGAGGDFTVTATVQGHPAATATARLKVLPVNLARWKLDEKSGTVAADAWGNLPGTLVGGPTWEAGKRGGALRLNGKGQYVDTKWSLDGLRLPCSFAFWVNPAATQGAHADIFGNHAGSTVGLVMQQEGAALNRYSFGYGSTPVGGSAGPVQLTANEWQHVAVVCNGKEVIIYLNGKEAVRGKGENPITPNPNLNFRLGSGYSGGRFFNGALDDFRIHARALSVEEVGELIRETDK